MSGAPDFIRFGRTVCGDLDQAERREWWLSNGLGGYAADAATGGNLDPPPSRAADCAGLSAAGTIADRSHHLSQWKNCLGK